MALTATSAFEILIQAMPDQALDAFGKVLEAEKQAEKSTKSWGDSIIALDAGFALIGRAVGLFQGIAGVIGGAASAITEFATAGGEFGEQKAQMENLAKSYGINADQIVRSLQDISGGTLAIGDAMRLASSAMDKGFGPEQIDTIFTYAKRRSEAMGEDFTQLGEQITSAMARGGRGLQQLGKELNITFPEGADPFESIREATKKFGETGFNLSDTLSALRNNWDELMLRIGDALQKVPAVEKVFVGLKTTFDALIRGDAIEEFLAAVSDWGEVAVQVFGFVLEEFGMTMDDIKKWAGETFSGVGRDARGVFASLIQFFGDTAMAVGATFNAVIDVFDFLTSYPKNLMVTFAQIFDFIFGGLSRGAAWTVKLVEETVTGVIKFVFGTIKEAFPQIENFIDMDALQAKITGGAKGISESIRGTFSGVSKFTQGLVQEAEASLAQSVTGTEGYRVNLDKIGESTANILQKIMTIPTPTWPEPGTGYNNFLSRTEEEMRKNQIDWGSVFGGFDSFMEDAASRLSLAPTKEAFERETTDLKRILKDSLEEQKTEWERVHGKKGATYEAFKQGQEEVKRQFEDTLKTAKENYQADEEARKEANKKKLEDMKEAFQEELDRTKQAQEANLETVKRGFEDQNRERRDSFEERKKDQEKKFEEEQRSAKEMADVQVEILKDSFEEQNRAAKEGQESRLEEMKRGFEKESREFSKHQDRILEDFERAQEASMNVLLEQQDAKREAMKSGFEKEDELRRAQEEKELKALRKKFGAEDDAISEERESQKESLRDSFAAQDEITRQAQEKRIKELQKGFEAEDKATKKAQEQALQDLQDRWDRLSAQDFGGSETAFRKAQEAEFEKMKEGFEALNEATKESQDAQIEALRSSFEDQSKLADKERDKQYKDLEKAFKSQDELNGEAREKELEDLKAAQEEKAFAAKQAQEKQAKDLEAALKAEEERAKEYQKGQHDIVQDRLKAEEEAFGKAQEDKMKRLQKAFEDEDKLQEKFQESKLKSLENFYKQAEELAKASQEAELKKLSKGFESEDEAAKRAQEDYLNKLKRNDEETLREMKRQQDERIRAEEQRQKDEERGRERNTRAMESLSRSMDDFNQNGFRLDVSGTDGDLIEGILEKAQIRSIAEGTEVAGA